MALKVNPTAKLEERLPIYKVEKYEGFDIIVSKTADITLAYELQLPEILTLSKQDYDQIHSSLVKAVRCLPVNSTVHKQDCFFEDKYVPQIKTDMPLLSKAFQWNFNERPFLNHKCYIFLTKSSSDRSRHSGRNISLGKRNLVPKDMMNDRVINDFLDKSSQFVKILTDSTFFKFRALTIDEICGSVDKPGILEKYLSLSPDGLTLQDIDLTEGLKIGTKKCSMFSVSHVDDLPPSVESEILYTPLSTDQSRFSLSFASPVSLNLSCNHIYNQYLFIDDEKQLIKQLESKKYNLLSLSKYSRENEVNYGHYEDFIKESVEGQLPPIRAHFNILLWSEDQEELKTLRSLTSSAIAKMDIRPKEATLEIGTLFWAGIPGNAGDFPREDTFITFPDRGCCFFNLETNYHSSSSDFGIKMVDRVYGVPIHVDISDEPMKRGIITNRNKFVLGPSGSGKSFFTNHMVRQYYDQGTHVVIVDVGHSYKGLCDLLGGIYLTYDEKKPISFNPFYISGDMDVEKKESIKTLLMSLWKKENEPISQSEYSTISDAVTFYYEALPSMPNVRPCFNSFYEFFRGPFCDYLRKNEDFEEKHFDIRNFLYVLQRYYKGGEFSFLLNSEQNQDLLNERFIIFELDNIKDHPILFPVVTLMIMETFVSKMRKLKGIRKMILIEEAWKAIAKEGTAEFIKYLFKTVRKFMGEAIVVTQEVDDIIGNPIVKEAIINNSDCKILLDQRKFMNRFNQIQTLLALTDKEKAQVLSINQNLIPGRKYKEVFISLQGHSKVYATEVSPEEYITYSTEQTEKVKLEKKTEKFGSIEMAIRESAEQIREGVF
ncbi:TraG family conjugative transposon ATPase [Cytophagaceae bacterium DM2B3-1]|uniref:TraG family conjugative transposon ATPase n=1 Tax=Xanthocytophaga flava TaxID=3048013 RepID=A0ABT7CV04_9BACT|nr:TraG family conjugative transposon ATPase [Xanthocytophaga flavus]MDJ1497599.1 TraG family conjugative transposon ATPase [Xanthocytophaga flavus]